MRCFVKLLLATSAIAANPAVVPKKVTFYGDIAPIVYKNCAPCHRPGESGPFPLLTYEDVKRHATQIADVTRRRYMPPWLPEPGYGDFIEERRLSAAQIQVIQDWVKQGSPSGSSAIAPAEPKFTSEWQLGRPDLVLQVSRPYQLKADGPEVFWNFIVPMPITATRWVRAIEIRPGNPRVVHHASIILDRSGAARRREQEPAAGFAGMDLTVEETTFDPDGAFLAWKPGNIPAPEPEGMAWRAEPGMDLVLNVHLRPAGKPESVNPSIGLYFSDQPQTRFPLLVELQRDEAIDIPPGDRDYIVRDDFRIPLDATVLAIYPHAHYLGKLLEGYATLPNGTRKWLIRIREWDLNWQGVYHFKKPVSLPRGTVISMRFHYDNTAANARNPNRPPRRVRGGSLANDEMGNLWLQLLPAGQRDERAVLEEALERQRLATTPGNFLANFNLGDLLLTRGKAAEAIPLFEKACQAQPGSAVAAAELGVALASASKMAEAGRQFRRALELDPKFTDARFNLANAEAATREWEAAARDFQQVLTEQPGHAKAQQHLGEVFFAWGDQFSASGNHEQAMLRYREALAYRPNDAELHMSLGVALVRVRRLTEAQSEFEAAVRIDPSFQPAQQALAAVRAQLRAREK